LVGPQGEESRLCPSREKLFLKLDMQENGYTGVLTISTEPTFQDVIVVLETKYIAAVRRRRRSTATSSEDQQAFSVVTTDHQDAEYRVELIQNYR
jgi:hypothetical protein